MSNYQYIYNRLRKAGLTDAVTLGFLGNWQQESGCETNRLNLQTAVRQRSEGLRPRTVDLCQ